MTLMQKCQISVIMPKSIQTDDTTDSSLNKIDEVRHVTVSTDMSELLSLQIRVFTGEIVYVITKYEHCVMVKF